MAEDRARSFIERYVIARASQFRLDREQEDLWACTQMAKSAYRMIADVAKTAEPSPDEAAPLANASQQGYGPNVIGGPGGGFAQAHTVLGHTKPPYEKPPGPLTRPPGPLTRAFRALNLKGEPV